VAFGSDRQSRLLSFLGWDIAGPAKLIIALVAAILITGSFIFLLAPLLLKFRSSKKPDPLQRSWKKFLKKLKKAGFEPRPSMAAMELAAMANGQLQYNGDAIIRIAELYTRCRYSLNAGNQAELTELIRQFEPRTIN
jgi:hypothetical protein